MSLVIQYLYSYYEDFVEKSDKRTENYFLVGSPVPIITIVTLYWFFVKKWGPKFMEYRQPYNLDRIIQIYNIFQVAANSYIILESAKYVIKYGVNLECINLDWESPAGLDQANVAYVYHIVKITDLLDTIFFILRKKNNQATFLHVYHNFMMAFVTFFVVKLVPGGHMSVIGFLNSFVHVVMYFYYFLTSFKPELKQSLWWKKHITQLQMAQFGYVMYHFFCVLFFYECDFPKIVSWMCFIQTAAFFIMFLNFYYRTYIQKRKI